MVPIQTKLYYAQIPINQRPSLKGSGDPTQNMERFSSRLSQERARANESPTRAIVNMIAQGGRKA